MLRDKKMPTEYHKYPRTYHVPWSEGLQNDDRRVETLDFISSEPRIIITEKLDGENSNLYRDHYHARSIDSKDHPSRHWLKKLHATICYDIPDGWRISGENMYALHSVYYTELPTYFLVFGFYDENNICLSWDQTVEFCKVLGLTTVPVLYDGPWDMDAITKCFTGKSRFKGWTPNTDRFQDAFAGEIFECFRAEISAGVPIEEIAFETQEGYVVRTAREFNYNEHEKYTCKWVRKGHVQCSNFWMNEIVIPNKLLKEK